MANHSSLPRSRQVPKRRRWRLWKLLLPISPLLLPLGWAGYREIENTWIEPQVVFVLGGEVGREKFAVQFAKTHPDLPIWISGGAPSGYTRRLFTKAGVTTADLHLDYQASDTVTNFTSLVDRFEAEGVDSVYLVTSDDHMPRARAIGEIVFGSRGIKVKPVSFPSGRATESPRKIFRDSLRALLWLGTGYTGR